MSWKHSGVAAIAILIAGLFAIVSTAEDESTMTLPPEAAKAILEGEILYDKHEDKEALDLFRKALELAPGNYDAAEKLINALDTVGEEAKDKEKSKKFFSEALALTERLVKRFPDDAKAHFLLARTAGLLSLTLGGQAKLLMGKRVERHAKKAIELDPKYAPGYVTLGIYYREVANLSWITRKLAESLFGALEGSMELSEQTLMKAVKLAPDTIYPNYALAVTLEKEGKTREAAKYYAKTLSLPRGERLDTRKQKNAREKLARLFK